MDGTLLAGWLKLLVARLDLTRYDMYIVSPDKNRHRSMNDLVRNLDKMGIEMDINHLEASVSRVSTCDANIPVLPDSHGRKPNKSGRK